MPRELLVKFTSEVGNAETVLHTINFCKQDSEGSAREIINAKALTGTTALMLAAGHGNSEVVSLLVEKHAEITEAAQQGLNEVMLSLLECGADTESRSSHDWTPLMHACFRGDMENAKFLLEFGAHVDGASQHDESPLVLAAALGHTRICPMLLDHGALTEPPWARKTLDDQDPRKQVPLERAYKLGWTPLIVACQGGHKDVVRLLLDHGANVEPKSPMEKNALGIAKENGRTAIVGMLEPYHDP